MACKHNRAPIDINDSLTKKHCELKCTYQFKYNPSQVVLTNKGTYLSLGDYNTDKVIYNNSKVDSHINPYIFSPSVHTFNGTTYDAELIVVHKGNGGMMAVCIPINGLGSSNTSLANVIDPKYLDQILLKNESVNPSGLEYNLSDTIKLGVPFFSYSSQLFFDNCQQCDYIIYTAPIIVSATSIAALRNILKPHNITPCTTNCPTLYYNKNGATDGSPGGEIYIECQPTDHSGKEIPVPTERTLPDIGNLTGIKLGIPTEHIIVGAISGMVLIFLLSKLLHSNKR
jgi:carbonic anhydrase